MAGGGVDLAALEQQYNLPPGILAATRQVESRGNPNAVSRKGAQGGFQIMPATAAALGGDPYDPSDAAVMAAKTWREGLDWSRGDVDLAARYYQGGPDTRKWGKDNAAYPGQILAALPSASQAAPPQAAQSAPAVDPTDPYEAAAARPQAPTPAAAGPNDPFEAAAARGRNGGDAGVSAPLGGSDAGNSGGQGSVRGDLRGAQQPPAQAQTQGAPAAAPPASPFGTAWDFASGLEHGAEATPATALAAAMWAARKLGVSPATLADAKRIVVDSLPLPLRAAHDFGNAPNDPNSWAHWLGGGAGEMASALPFTELRPLEMLSPGSKIGQVLARYGDLALQGGAAGAGTSRGADVGGRALGGALLAPVAGRAIEAVAPPLARIAGGIEDYAGRAAAALRARWPEAAPPEAAWENAQLTPEAAARLRGAEVDSEPGTGGTAGMPLYGREGDVPFYGYDAAGRPVGADYIGEVYDAQGNPAGINGRVTDEGDAPVQVTPDMLAAAMGNRAASNGIEATRDLPPAVAANAEALRAQGVPAAEALREADLRAVPGVQPTIAAVRRSPEDMAAMFEGAKANTAEGNALNQAIADNNAALHAHVQQMVADNGGVPAQGEAAETAARSLAQASDAAKARTAAAYDAARAAEGDARVSIDGLRELLATRPFRAPTTAEGRQLASGLREQIDAMTAENRGRFTPGEIEELNQAANDAFNPMGRGANRMIGQVKAALNESMDQIENAGPLFRQARALHRQWAEQYDNPAGIERLIRRDAKGNFVNEDDWRKAEGFVGTLSDKAFVQVVRQLRANGDAASLARLKASVIQRAYQRATNSAADRLGNATLNGRLWNAELNRIGMPKLRELFDRGEIASLAHIGRVAVHMNEAIPGSVNTSGTASATANLARAIGAVKNGPPKRPLLRAAGKVAGHVLVGHAMPGGMGNVALEMATHAGAKLGSNAAAEQLAAALREQMDPAAARAAEAARASAANDNAARAALARSLSNRLAAPAASQRSR